MFAAIQDVQVRDLPILQMTFDLPGFEPAPMSAPAVEFAPVAAVVFEQPGVTIVDILVTPYVFDPIYVQEAP